MIQKYKELFRYTESKTCIRSPNEPHRLQKELKQLKKQNVDRVMLKIHDRAYQNVNLLTEQDIQQIKADRREYMRILLTEYQQIYPEELVNFKWRSMKARQTKKSVLPAEMMEQLNFQKNAATPEKSDDDERESSENGFFLDDGDGRSNLVNESRDEMENSYGGDGARDDYD